MREFSRVAPRFWTGPTGRAIKAKGRDAQVMALYLFTGPSANMIGLYYLPIPTICHEAGFSPAEVRSTLALLAEIDFAFYDEAEELVWVPAAALYQIGEILEPRDKRAIGVKNLLKPFRGHKFARQFVNRYRVPYSLHINDDAKDHTRTFQAPSKPGAGTGAGAGAGVGVTTPPKAPPSDEGGAREDDPFELPPPPDPPGTNGHGSLTGPGLRRAVDRVVQAEVDAGRLVDDRARKGIRKQLRSGIPEDAVLDALRRQAQTEGDMQRGAQRALDWIEARGGADAVAEQAIRWALDHREGRGDHRVYTRWLAQEAVPPFVLGFIGHALAVKERANPPPDSAREEQRRS